MHQSSKLVYAGSNPARRAIDKPIEVCYTTPMIKITDDIVVLEFRQEELDRIKRPEDMPEGTSGWPLVIPEEYADWHQRWTLIDYQTNKWVVVLTKTPIHILQEVVTVEGRPEVVERIWGK
jgi:hypothetical protein